MTRRRGVLRGTVVATALVAAAGLVDYFWSARTGHRLPARLRIEEPIADLVTGFRRESVAQENAADPIRMGGLRPSLNREVDGGHRPAIVTPPPSLVRFRVRVPEGGALRFGVGIESPGKRDPEADGVRFAVTVDGRQVFARVVNPATTRHDRSWFDHRVDLDAAAGREVEVVLATEAAGGKPRLAGTPGWSDVRVTRETLRDRQRASPSAPSVLVLLVDTLRADRLGPYGASPSPSPTLDELARAGLVFEQAVAQAAWTMPSVATIFTGLHPRSHGVLGGDAASFLPDPLETLAERAADAGVTTVGVLANQLVSRATNYAQGFETFVELEPDRETKAPPAAAIVNQTFLTWLKQNRGLRFLAYLHYMEPHDPYTPPAELRPPSPAGVQPAIAAGNIEMIAKKINWHNAPLLAPPEVEHLRRLYDAEIAGWDRELGRLLDGLAALGLRESTTIVMTADHGEAFQEHGRLKHGLHLYEEQVRVPLILAGPAISPGRVREQAQGIDVFPTVATLLGVAVPPGLPGQNLLGTREARPVFSETHFGFTAAGAESALVALRTPRWKLIHAPGPGQFELYDLTHDPAERENRFEVAPEAAALAAELVAWRPVAPPPPPAARDPQLREKLRALGYVE